MRAWRPIYDYEDGFTIIGGVVYETRRGRPLRPYGAGIYISIKEKLGIILLEHPEWIHTTWCEFHLKLSAAPNHAWLKRLHHELRIEWNPTAPYVLEKVDQFELKFEGDLLAVVCPQYNLDHTVTLVGNAINNASNFLYHNKGPWNELFSRAEIRRKRITDQYVAGPGETPDDLSQEYSDWYTEESKKLEASFVNAAIPHLQPRMVPLDFAPPAAASQQARQDG
jgi:hypothetical protein